MSHEQFENYFLNTTFPNYEKEFKGAKLYLANGFRGQETGIVSMIWIFKSEVTRNLYFTTDGGNTELGLSIGDELKPINDGLIKLGSWTSKYTDWLVK
ncbi:MAG: hypothetical protein HQ474_10360 [Flammeovirgaceae bacterium]|nr:hypothetical protein [Flammeovirgaceae bacterium]